MDVLSIVVPAVGGAIIFGFLAFVIGISFSTSVIVRATRSRTVNKPKPVRLRKIKSPELRERLQSNRTVIALSHEANRALNERGTYKRERNLQAYQEWMTEYNSLKPEPDLVPVEVKPHSKSDGVPVRQRPLVHLHDCEMIQDITMGGSARTRRCDCETRQRRAEKAKHIRHYTTCPYECDCPPWARLPG